jgi:hypothetical protein
MLTDQVDAARSLEETGRISGKALCKSLRSLPLQTCDSHLAIAPAPL